MKDLKRYNPNTFNALHAGAAYITFWVWNFLLSLIFADSMVDTGIQDYSPYLCLQILVMSAGLLLIVVVFSLIARSRPINGGGFLARKGCGTEMLMAVVLAFGLGSILLPLATSFAGDFETISRCFSSGGGVGVSIDTESGFYILYVLVLIPVLPAIFEELLFRGVILKGLMQFGKVTAVVGSALLFALAHGSYQQFIYQFLGALAIGCVVVETKNIVVGMMMHFGINLFASWGQLSRGIALQKEQNSNIYSAVVGIMTVLIGTVCLVAAAVYFGKRILHSARFPEKTRADVAASFVVNDMVSGTLIEEKSWFDCGGLPCELSECKRFRYGSKVTSTARLNRKAKMLPTLIVLGVGIVIALFFFIMSVIVS